jgi:hypothetical protein
MCLALAAAAALISGAPAAGVISYEPNADFRHYRSYEWVFPHAPANLDPTLYRQVRAAVDHSLQAQGFRHSQHGDLAVAFTLGRRSNMHPEDYGHYAFYYSPAEAATHRDWVNRELAERTDHDDLLSIDIYDAATKHSIWHGIAPVPIVSGTRQRVIEHEVDDVLSQFPPKH